MNRHNTAMHPTTTILKSFPFKSVLSLQYLITFWKDLLHSGKMPFISQGVLEKLAQAPELEHAINEIEVLEKHQELIRFLMSAVIPPASMDSELTAAIVPLQNRSFFSTKAFDKAIPLGQLDDVVSINVPGTSLVAGKTIHACLLVLHQFYNVEIELNKPILFTIRDEGTGLDKVYKVEVNHQFTRVVAKSDPEPINPNVIKFLIERIYDIDLLIQYIRPENFEFHGFTIMRLVDVTEEEMLSSIKYDLLKKDAVANRESFGLIQHKLQSIFQIPDLRVGLAYFGPTNNLIMNQTSQSWKSLINSTCCDFKGSVYERSWTEKRYIIIENIEEYPYKTPAEEALLQNGIQNILLAPLVEDGETIGMLELASPLAGQIHSLSATKVENILPMFTAAVKRVKEEMDTEVRALIQEECTAIHPTVQWRFFEAGVNLLNKRKSGESASLEEIVFDEVYPLFGMVDVRNSSVERNTAIQQDLQQNLEVVKELLLKINAVLHFPLIEEIIFSADKHIAKLHQNIASGDESNVLDFLKHEVNPLLKGLEENVHFKDWIAAYKNILDPTYGIVYTKRKAFEESLHEINAMLSHALEEAEENAQQMFPHYFEKYKTDGVEFTLYLGSSLVQNKTFDPFYLKNFRLWQLLLTCEINRRMNALKPSLKNDLDITQLILVHDHPVSIRFRSDERQFDVDGAYDIRYEIIKKRIDKALLKNSRERLTQPGKIAIVFNHTKVAEEYKHYFNYLINKGLIEEVIEEFELEDLPGATGLKALRITLQSRKNKMSFNPGTALPTDIEEENLSILH